MHYLSQTYVMFDFRLMSKTPELDKWNKMEGWKDSLITPKDLSRNAEALYYAKLYFILHQLLTCVLYFYILLECGC